MFLAEIRFCLLFITLFQSCGETVINNNTKIIDIARRECEVQNCDSIYNIASDSLKLWILNKLGTYTFEVGKFEYQLDSLLCINNKKNRLITCLLEKVIVKGADSDGLIFFYGEKINNKWYFFKGSSIVISRKMIKNDSLETSLSYKQLHQIALKEVYNGYLKDNGKINEEWFTSHFENVGWCSTCKTTEDFQKSRLEDVRTLWLQRDTSLPIKQLPTKNSLP